MNRRERRAKSRGKSHALPALVRITQNGITQGDLKREYDIGYRNGVDATLALVYAATAIAADDLFGFKKVRTLRLLKYMDQVASDMINGADGIKEVQRRFGYTIDFNAPFDRVQEVDDD